MNKSYSRMCTYPSSTQILNKDNSIKIKKADGKWIRFNRYLAEQQLGRELKQNERVYRIDSTQPDGKNNMVIHRFNITKIVFNPRSRPIYIPELSPAQTQILEHGNQKEINRLLKTLTPGVRKMQVV